MSFITQLAQGKINITHHKHAEKIITVCLCIRIGTFIASQVTLLYITSTQDYRAQSQEKDESQITAAAETSISKYSFKKSLSHTNFHKSSFYPHHVALDLSLSVTMRCWEQ